MEMRDNPGYDQPDRIDPGMLVNSGGEARGAKHEEG